MNVVPWRSRTAQASGQSVLPPIQWGLVQELSPKQRYDVLRAYYSQVGLYAPQRRATYDDRLWMAAVKAIRGVVNRTVEFHAAHLWPGTLPDALTIVTDHAAIIEPIQQVWTWSNWAAQKQVAARWLAMLGDLFVKVREREDRSRVYFELIDPAYVTEFDTDERGFLVYIRLDIPKQERTGDKTRDVTHTEVWDKERYRLWVHEKQRDEDLSRLGVPREERPLTDFGIDFVPFVHAMFRDIGDSRGQAAVWAALEKIDEANLKATRLSQMLFRHNKVTWALMAGGNDASGRPLPPPTLPGGVRTVTGENTGTVTFGDDTLLSLPGNSTLESLVPNLHYGEALTILQDDMAELERDLPELAYARISEQGGGDLSGRAIRFMLTPAIDRALEARGNAEAALVRANQMALTIGARAGLFSRVGTFEAGDFDHSFAARPVITVSEEEESAALLARAQAAETVSTLLSAADRLRLVFPDWDEQRIDQAVADKEAETPEPLRQLDAFSGAPQTSGDEEA